MANTSTIVFAGDASGVRKAAKQADDALETVGRSATTASDDMAGAGQASEGLNGRLGSLGAGISGLTDGVDAASGAMQALVDVQNYSYERAQKLARAQADVEQALLDGRQAAIDLEQATVDLNQAQADGRQAGIDLEQAQIDITQAQLDAKTALQEYNAAVKEHGAGSAEARQAAIDLKQAQLDEKQAVEDGNQARIDANQALTDGKQYALDAAQAVRDGKDAQLNLNDAMREANPSGLSQWNDALQVITPILSGLVGIIGLVTAAQWAWNAALAVTGIPLIIAGVVALIAVIVLIATKTTWFQDLWKWTWGGIKKAASAVAGWFTKDVPKFFSDAWEKIREKWGKVTGWFRDLGSGIKRVFSNIGSAITAPFRAAFNAISRAWNNTVGRLSFTVPGWIPGIGGNSFSAPRLPYFHAGGRVPGTPGQDVLAVLQAGERVESTASQVGTQGETVTVVIELDGDKLLTAIAKKVDQRGGSPRALGLRVA
jgi:hypothetical protein